MALEEAIHIQFRFSYPTTVTFPPTPNTDAPTNAPVTNGPTTNAPVTNAPVTNAPSSGNNAECYDANAEYGIKESSKGMAGCPPDHTGFFLVNTDASNADIGFDTHMYVGTHISDRVFVSAGAGLEAEIENPKYDAVVNAMELCPKMSDYNVPGGTTLTGSTTNGTFKCKKNFKWSWRSKIAGKSEKFGYVTASPDGSYVLAAGIREKQKTSSGFVLQRYLVKIDAATGQTIWELKMPINDALIGNAAGYESLQFTEDGGFVVGGFANYEGRTPNRFDLLVALQSIGISK